MTADWREKRNERLREWCKNNPVLRFGRYFRHRLKTKYGMNPQLYDAMILAQHGRCLICREFMDIPSATNRVRNGKSVVVDHDHTTTEVRGLLCNNCNRAIGLLSHNTETIKRAAIYLEAWEKLRDADAN